MRILGIDYGTKNVGFAISDYSETIATEYEIVLRKDCFSFVADLVKKMEIEMIVLGLPVGLNGQETVSTLQVREFAKKLERLTRLPVELFDEVFTSDYAQRIRPSRGHQDALSAQIVLQDFLDKRKNKQN